MAARAGARAALVGRDAAARGAGGAAAVDAARRPRRRQRRGLGRGPGSTAAAGPAAGQRRREHQAGARWIASGGQASVELVAAVPALLLAALIALQLLLAGYALTLADGAAEAGALALASGRSAGPGRAEGLPGWAEDDVDVAVDRGRVTVRLSPPSPFGLLDGRLVRLLHRRRRGKGERGCPRRPGRRGGRRPGRRRGAGRALGPSPTAPGCWSISTGAAAPRPSLIATAAARELEERLVAHLPEAGVASRGRICHLALPADEGGLERVAAALAIGRDGIVAVHLAAAPGAGGAGGAIRPSGALLRADLAEDRALTALAVGDLLEHGVRPAVMKRPLGWIAARRALAGARWRPARAAFPLGSANGCSDATPSPSVFHPDRTAE